MTHRLAYVFFETVDHEIDYLVLVWLLFHIAANFSKGVVDYGYEHVDENEHHKHCVTAEKDWSNDTIGVEHFLQSELAQKSVHQRRTAFIKGSKPFHGLTKNQARKQCKGQKRQC